MTDDDVRRQIDQLLCKNFDAADVTASPAVIDLEIAALAPTELVETLPKIPQCPNVRQGRSRRPTSTRQSGASARPAAPARRAARRTQCR